MSLGSALSIATGGLANINAQFALISQNIANASTPGYAVETGTQTSITADGSGLGVHTGAATRQIDLALQASVVRQNATVTGLQTTQTALQAVDGVLGTPGAGTDLGSLLGKLQDGFASLLTDPSSQAQQDTVVTNAATLAQGINRISSAYTAQRQAAQDDLSPAVASLNATLSTIGELSNQIIALKPTDQSTADLESQRDAAVLTLSQLTDVKTVEQTNGDLSIFTATGLTLPTRNANGAFAVGSASTPPGAWYPGGGLPGITLSGADVTGQLSGGRIGADITLRDTTLPAGQAALDEFAQGVSSRFSAQGLTLYTDGSGNTPTGGGTPAQAGYVGFSSSIQVNAAVTANPVLVRDGTTSIAGSGSGASAFTPNPAGGPAGFADLIQRVVNYTFGSQAQSGVNQPALNTNGLGASGNLTLPFGTGNGSLAGYATNLVASHAQQSAAVSGSLSTEQALQTSLNAKVSSVSGVNTDSEMAKLLGLQNAYSANARIISTVQTMFNQLLQAVQ